MKVMTMSWKTRTQTRVQRKTVFGLVAALLLCPHMALAQEDEPWDQDMEEFKIEVCRAHAGCDMTYHVGMGAKKAKGFFDKIGDAFSRKGHIDTFDVVEASEPEFVETSTSKPMLQRIREILLGSGDADVKTNIHANDKSVEWSEGRSDSKGKLSGAAAVLYSTGMKMRGTFADGTLNGYGQKIYPDGAMDFGNMKDGFLSGSGVRTGVRDGRIFAMEGKFIGGSADGVMTVTYVDGSSRHDIYAKGKELMRGLMVAKGESPVTPIYKTPAQLAAEAEENFQSLLRSGTAEQVYSTAQQMLDKGDLGKARLAFSAVSSRFPSNTLAATAIAQLTRLDTLERERQRLAQQQQQAQIARQQEAARQAQLARQQAEIARQQAQRAEEDRRRREAAAWSQLGNTLKDALSKKRGGSGGAGQTSDECGPYANACQ